MAHCPYEKVQHLRHEFDLISSWDGIKEKKPGIFYYRSKGFLHFHIKEKRIWADIRSGDSWGPEINISEKMTSSQRAAFLKIVEEHYKKTSSK